MKKNFSAMLVSAILLFMLAFACSAEDGADKLLVINSAGETVQSYEIIRDNPSLDSRDTIARALRYARDNATETDIYTVKLPKGEYCLFQSLNIYSNTILDFSDSYVTRAEGCGSMVRFGASKDVTYGYEGYKNIKIKDAVFDAKNIGTSSFIRFAHASDVEIEGITFENTTDVHHLLTFAASENVRIRNCIFRNMKITEKLSSNNCEAVQIDILKEGYFTYPAYDGTTTKNVSITGCTFENVPRGIGTHSGIAGYYFEGMTFVGNTFKNIEGYAIRTLNYTDSIISDNVITDCGSGISCGTVTNEGLSNFFAPGKGMSLRADSKLIVRNNRMTLKSLGADTTAFGIRLYGAKINNFTDGDGKRFTGDCRISGVTIENNAITGSVTHKNFYAIHIDGAKGSAYGKSSNVSIKNNKVVFNYSGNLSNTVYGIRAENSEKLYFFGNTVTDKRARIHSSVTALDCKNLYFEKNSFEGAKSYGIKLEDISSAKLISNSITNTKSNGIYVLEGCKNIYVTSNKIKKCSGYGIAVKDGKVASIGSNSIYNCKKYSIYITGKATVKNLASNYICGGKATAVYLNSTASATTVKKNIIDLVNKNADGISVNGKATVTNITSNKINGKAKKESKKLKVKCKNGITLNSTACKIKNITGNTINQCQSSGIYISKAKTKASLSKNTIKKARYGISYKKAKAKLGKNTFKSCTGAKTRVI